IVSSYREAYGRGWYAFANRLVPPNVFPFEHEGLAAKYAVLSEADFARENGPQAGTVSVWARFAQPSRLVWVRAAAAREQAVPAEGQGDEPGAARQGDHDLRRRRRLYRLEDQPPCGDRARGEALAAALADSGRAYSAASSASAGCDPLKPPLPWLPLMPPSAASPDLARAPTGKALPRKAGPRAPRPA